MIFKFLKSRPFLLSRIIHVKKVKVSVTQSCLNLCNPMECSLPDSSVHGILQARILEWVALPLLQGIFLTQDPNPSLLHCRQILYYLSHQQSPLHQIPPTILNMRTVASMDKAVCSWRVLAPFCLLHFLAPQW